MAVRFEISSQARLCVLGGFFVLWNINIEKLFVPSQGSKQIKQLYFNRIGPDTKQCSGLLL